MTESTRGPERRRDHSTASETTQPDERRNGADRRRNSFISDLDLCRGLPYSDVEDVISRCPIQTLSAGEVLLEPGQPNHHLYFLISGRLEVRLKSSTSPIADVINPGECMGEMSIIDGQPTSAYVISAEPSRVIAVHETVFWSKIATNPDVVRNLSRVLAERMRKRNAATLRALEKEIRLEQLQKELGAAYEIQTGILAQGPELLRDFQTLDVHARMDVVKSVGGDFYDAFALDDERVCIAIGDVSGKGMPAALFMVRALTLLRAELNRDDELALCMQRFNTALCATNITHMFVSLIVLRIDVQQGTVDYVNAGHPPMLVSSADSPYVAVDESKGMIAGVLNDNTYRSATFRLGAGDRVLLYTDGVTETRNSAKQFYQQEGLEQYLATSRAEDSAETVDGVFSDARGFAERAPVSDDITVIAIRFLGH